MTYRFLMISASTLALAAGFGAATQAADVTQSVLVNKTVADNQTEDFGSLRSNDIGSSQGNGAIGVMQHQQNEGSANALSVTVDVMVNTGPADITQDISVSATSHDNLVADTPNPKTGGNRDNQIRDAYKPFSGVLSVQQNNGDANVVGATNVVAANVGGENSRGDANQTVDVTGTVGVFPSDGGSPALGSGGSFFDHDAPLRHATTGSRANGILGDAFRGAEGIVNVQQNNGSGNVMNTVNAVRANVDATGRDTRDDVDDIWDTFEFRDQQVAVTSQVGGAVGDHTADRHSILRYDRENDLSNAFQAGKGIVAVQQNNGDANVLGAVNAVAADIRGEEELDGTLGSPSLTVTSIVRNVQTRDGGTFRENAFAGAFRDFQGIAAVQQNNGNANAMSIGNSVAANIDVGEGDSSFSQNRQSSQATVRVEDARALVRAQANDPSHRINSAAGVFGGAQGIAEIQQNNGDNNAIAAASAVIVSTGTDEGHGPTDGLTADSTDSGVFNSSADSDQSYRHNYLLGAFQGFSGVASVQQNNGNNNGMVAMHSVSATIDAARHTVTRYSGHARDTLASVAGNRSDALAEADRGNEVFNSTFSGSRGVATVQQNNGDNNLMAARTAVTASIGGWEGTFGGTGDTAAISGLDVRGNQVTDHGSTRYNSVNDSFSGYSGIATVQQNNGDANAMSASTAVAMRVGNQAVLPSAATSNTTATVNGMLGNTQLQTQVLGSASRTNSVADGIFNGAAGLATVQQNNGDANAIGSALGFQGAAGSSGVPSIGIHPPSAPASDAQMTATVSQNNVTVGGELGAPQFENLAEGGFQGFSGVATIQQNNGNNNAIQASVNVVANVQGTIRPIQ